ncbi:MAG TPA: toll/interleukin-1 receptor domain-containing protein [Ktedonobacterales bacterium]|jgi:hypothetical protein
MSAIFGKVEKALPSIFLSYRRDDTGSFSRALAKILTAAFGKSRIFLDTEAIEVGERFPQRLKSALASSDCVAVIIGTQWATITDSEGRLRLFQPDDWVRLEVEAALQAHKRIVPVLSPGAVMPQPSELPVSIQPLVTQFPPVVVTDQHNIDSAALALFRHAIAAEYMKTPAIGRPVAFVFSLVFFLVNCFVLLRQLSPSLLKNLISTDSLQTLTLFCAIPLGALLIWHLVLTREWEGLFITAVIAFVLNVLPPPLHYFTGIVIALGCLRFSSTARRRVLRRWLSRMGAKVEDFL